jgi:hypothetical protein
MIRFKCPECGSQMEVDESFAGRPARCPTCGAGLKVPAEGESTAIRPTGAPPAGAARVRIGDEEVDVIPPLETMVLVSMACVALSVVVFLLAGLTRFVAPPWAVGALLGALLALLGIIVGVPAYHSVRRSKGRKRGRTHAVISMLAGTGLFLVFLVVALVGFARDVWMRPTCEENLQRIYSALRSYADDHEGKFPSSLETLVDDGYLASNHWLTCPAHKMPVGETTYVLTPQINISAKRPDGRPWWPPDTMIVCDGRPDAHKDRRVRVLLLSGKIEQVPTEEWYSYRKTQNNQWSRTINQIRALREEAEADEGESAAPAPAAAPAAEENPP